MSLKYQRIKQADLSLPAPLRWLTRAFSSVTLAVILLSTVAVYSMLGTLTVSLLTQAGLYAAAVIGTVGAAVVFTFAITRLPFARWSTATSHATALAALGAIGVGIWQTVARSDYWTTQLETAAHWLPMHPWQGAAWIVGLVLVTALLVLASVALVGWRRPRWSMDVRINVGLVLFAAFAAAGVGATHLCDEAYWWVYYHDWFTAHRALVINRLPWLEMTTQEYYGWWPMQTLLILFVINMVWATIRRIEFKFVNIGVLTVHTGIVTLALGSILYGHLKVEGDTILFRDDARPASIPAWRNEFYDASEAALYLDTPQRETPPVVLKSLPRFNDYELGELNMKLHDRPAVQPLIPEEARDRVRITIPGFIAYGRLTERWLPPEQIDPSVHDTREGEALRVRLGDRERPHESSRSVVLQANVPAARVARVRRGHWSIEYLDNPGEQRVRDLASDVGATHGLVVRVPGQDFRKVYAIEPGETIEVGETGYTLDVEEIGPYNMPFATEGYEGAMDTRARVQVEGNGKNFTRIAMHRYPERSQDFVPAPNDPNAGPMGRRKDPDPAIQLTYLDNSRAQYHVIKRDGANSELSVIARLGSQSPKQGSTDGRVPLPTPGNETLFAHIERVVGVWQPQPAPRAQRDPDDEGNFIHALVPVRIEVDLPASEGGGMWQRLVWLNHMRYPELAAREARPRFVDVPTVGQLKLAFSRQRRQLPFAMKLNNFEMTPYAGSDMPRNFRSDVLLADVTDSGMVREQPVERATHLNNPIVYYPEDAALQLFRVKITQQGWDPPEADEARPNAKNAQGNFINQQRFTVLGIGNNVGFYIIATGAIMVIAGIPWAFYVKPLLVQRQKRKLQAQLQKQQSQPQTDDQTPEQSNEKLDEPVTA